jgi:hypothetical protein
MGRSAIVKTSVLDKVKAAAQNVAEAKKEEVKKPKKQPPKLF